MADVPLTAVGVTFTHARTKFILQVKKLGQQGKNSGITMILLAMLLFCSLLTLHFKFFPVCSKSRELSQSPCIWRAELLQIGNNLSFSKAQSTELI